ncbi:F-box/kelch-repeat protein At5g42350-like [Primulina tabacum]|uniref:F-box/kelch-repeat protein At5g42350-like n=1 Tax=Primulina tabacum TaxID=48773 RepID=UPI003F59A333
MSSPRLTGEDHIDRDIESLSVSKRLVRSMSQKFKKKNQKIEVREEDEVSGMSLRCLSIYGRGGGCKVGADTSEDYGDSGSRRRSSASEEGKGYTMICGTEEATVDCFAYGMKEKFWRKNNRKLLTFNAVQQNNIVNACLPDDILEMCLVRLPLTSLMNARLVCKKWRNLTTTPRFMQMRREGLFQNPWLFVFGVVKDGYCSGEIHAFDVSLKQWHKLDSHVLKGRFLFSVTSIQDDIYVVGGCSSLTNFGRVDRSSFKTHKGVLAFSPSTKSWRKVAAMKYARSSPILGISEFSSDCLIIRNQQNRTDRRFYRPRVGGVSDVYEDPHRLSVRRQSRHSLDENDNSLIPNIKTFKFVRQKQESSHSKDSRKFIMIAVGGLGSWDEPLDSGEIYDSVSNKWTEIQKVPLDFGVACSGVICDGIFYVYSESDKLVGYDVERGYWTRIQTTPFPPRLHEYYPKLISCKNRLLMLSVSWCEGDGQIGRRNKAVRKLWELDLEYRSWTEVSVHPDAPMDWNAAFVADEDLIFGVEMFKIFGQVLDFLTMFNVSDTRTTNWSHISKNHVAHDLDASSCMTKSMAVLRL